MRHWHEDDHEIQRLYEGNIANEIDNLDPRKISDATGKNKVKSAREVLQHLQKQFRLVELAYKRKLQDAKILEKYSTERGPA